MLSSVQKIVVITFVAFVFFIFASIASPANTLAGRTCCKTAPGGPSDGTNCNVCDNTIYWKNQSAPCGPNEANCRTCPGDGPSDRVYGNECGGDHGGGEVAACAQSIYAVPIPANMQVGQNLDFYADGRATKGNFYRMIASVTNVPASTPAVATVATTSGPTCYANGNCRQGFRLTARNNGTALLKVTTQVKLCPACAVTGSCSGTRTVNVGPVTSLQCNPGAKCVSDTGTFKVGSNVTCSMPVLPATELGGGTASYQSECTPFKGAVAQAKVAKSSTTGTFTAYKIPTGVTNLKCSFRHCISATSGVTTCTDWGKAS